MPQTQGMNLISHTFPFLKYRYFNGAAISPVMSTMPSMCSLNRVGTPKWIICRYFLWTLDLPTYQPLWYVFHMKYNELLSSSCGALHMLMNTDCTNKYIENYHLCHVSGRGDWYTAATWMKKVSKSAAKRHRVGPELGPRTVPQNGVSKWAKKSSQSCPEQTRNCHLFMNRKTNDHRYLIENARQ